MQHLVAGPSANTLSPVAVLVGPRGHVFEGSHEYMEGGRVEVAEPGRDRFDVAGIAGRPVVAAAPGRDEAGDPGDDHRLETRSEPPVHRFRPWWAALWPGGYEGSDLDLPSLRQRSNRTVAGPLTQDRGGMGSLVAPLSVMTGGGTYRSR